VKRTNSERCKDWYAANRDRKIAYEACRRPIIAERQAARKRWLYNNDPEHHAYKLAKVNAYNRAHRAQLNKSNRERRNIDCMVAKMIADTKDDPLLKKDDRICFVYGKTRKREL
jgi:hypothetical protein